MVDGRIRKAEKDLVRAGNGGLELAVCKEVRRKAIGIVPADGAEDHIDLRVAERREKVRRAILRMIFYILDTGERVRHEPDVEPIVRKALCADIQLMLCKALPQHTGGKAHDRNVFYHDIHLFFPALYHRLSSGATLLFSFRAVRSIILPCQTISRSQL